MSNAASSPEGTHAPGSLFAGKYVIDRTLGQGGMGVVLAARHPHLHELVAIKCLLPEFANDATIVARFVQEARSARRIRSEHVVRIDDVDTLPSGAPYIVMECLAGKNLEELVVGNGPLPVAVAVDYLAQALEAIAEAHALGIVHRDLKPANLFLSHRTDGSPCVKVLDFGISKVANAGMADGGMTKTSAMLGSPHYMSPEQIRSTRDVDPRSDIWAIGIILHELLTGTTPFNSESIPYLFVQIMQEPPPPLRSVRQDVPVALERAVTKCLEKDPARRFANVGELAAALAECGSASARASAERVVRVIHGHGATAAAFAPTGFAQPAVVLPQGPGQTSPNATPYTASGTDPNGRPYFAPGPTNPNGVAPYPMEHPLPKRPNVALFAASGVAGLAVLALVGVLAFNAGSHREGDATAVTGAAGTTTGGTAGATPATGGSAATADPGQPLAPLAPLAASGAQTPTAAATPVGAKPHAVAAAQSAPSRPAAAATSPAANAAPASAPAANTPTTSAPPASRGAPASDDDGDHPSAVHQFFSGLGHTVKRTVNQVTQ